ncbi:MAG: ATP-binding cassette domain-containing protein, partial [Fusobacteriaceae bacterium]
MKIKVRNLKKQYGDVTVLKDLHVELENIHTLVIIGPSGGGKSTFLRIMAGLETIQEGDILLNGEEIPKEDEELVEYRKKVGVVFQAFNLFPHLSALKNITLPLEKVHGIKSDVAHERGVKLLKRYRLEEHMHKKPHQLSGGQQQRVAIIRALAL